MAKTKTPEIQDKDQNYHTGGQQQHFTNQTQILRTLDRDSFSRFRNKR